MSKNVTLTLSIPAELKNELNELKGVNWSEETRTFLVGRVERLKSLKLLDEALKDSKLTPAAIDEISKKINKGIAKKHEQWTKKN